MPATSLATSRQPAARPLPPTRGTVTGQRRILIVEDREAPRHQPERVMTPDPGLDVSSEAMEALLAYDWPGNIRQLETAIERASIMSDDGRICPEDLPPEVLKPAAARRRLTVSLRRPLAEQVAEITAAFEERYLRKALKMSRGSIGRTAIIAGMSRRTVTTKVAAFKIDRGALTRE